MLVGLHVDLPGPAELVEVVDVVRAEIDLQGVEHVADLHAQGHALGAVDVQVQPGRIGAGAVEQALQSRRPVAGVDDLVADALQLVQAQVAAVLDDELEAAGGAQSVDGRCAEGRDDGPLTSRWQRSRSVAAMASAVRLRPAPLGELVEQDVHRAQVRGVGAEDQRLAGDAHGVRHAGVWWTIVSMLGHHAARCARTEAESGNCTFEHQVALVLLRDEARWARR